MRVLDFPSIETLLNGNHSHFPYTKSFQDVRDDPLVSLHTSGSTGWSRHSLIILLEDMLTSSRTAKAKTVYYVGCNRHGEQLIQTVSRREEHPCPLLEG